MEENQYSNNYYTNRSQGTPNPNYYQTSSTNFRQSQMNYQSAGAPKKPKKSGGFGKKVLTGLCCGLIFGIFAGVGFQAVDMARSGLDRAKGVFSVVIGNSPEEEATTQEAQLPMQEDRNTVQQSADAVQEDTIRETSDALAQVPAGQAVVTDVTEVVKAVMPSVVSVSNTYVEYATFFGQQYSSEAVSSGSGIIVGENDNELLIVTNYHVVDSAKELSVQFVDEEQVKAQVKGTDMDKDLAVIAVQLSDIDRGTLDQISIATMGDSDELVVGQPVIAIGNALGYGQSVTTGVVSALNRAIALSSQEEQRDSEINCFIQTDAAINPGNSGGALLNTKGEVIGINSSKIGGNAIEGMGYAIPISDAEPIIEELMQKETRFKVDEAKKGYLGITGVNVEAEYSEVYGIPKGVYISSVTEGTGAEAAGLVRGDIITGINGQEVESMEELKEEMNYYQDGDTITLTIMQGSPTGYQSKDVQVTLGKQAG